MRPTGRRSRLTGWPSTAGSTSRPGLSRRAPRAAAPAAATCSAAAGCSPPSTGSTHRSPGIPGAGCRRYPHVTVGRPDHRELPAASDHGRRFPRPNPHRSSSRWRRWPTASPHDCRTGHEAGWITGGCRDAGVHNGAKVGSREPRTPVSGRPAEGPGRTRPVCQVVCQSKASTAVPGDPQSSTTRR